MSAPPTTSPLPAVIREIEAHVAASGWDRPAQLFALVPTADLVTREPALAARLGLEHPSAAESLTPVEQEQLPPARPFEEALAGIMWPAEVAGAGAVVERVVLPAEAEAALPLERAAARRFAAEHPARQEVRVAVGVLRDGQAHCVVRLRAHDREDARLEGADLVPGLVRVLAETLDPGPVRAGGGR